MMIYSCIPLSFGDPKALPSLPVQLEGKELLSVVFWTLLHREAAKGTGEKEEEQHASSHQIPLLYRTKICRLFVIPLFTAVATPIKCRRRLVSTSDLYLHEEGSVVRALRATGFRSIHIVPCIRSTKDIVNLFLLCLHGGGVNPVHIVEVRASRAAKSHSSSTIFQQQQISTNRTKVHDLRGQRQAE